MKLQICGSSSLGNAYVLSNSTEALILECGLPLMEVKKALNFNISKVKGVLITHPAHSDHGKYLKDYIKYFNCYSHREGLGFHELENHYNAMEVQPNVMFKAGSFSVVPFDLVHDVRCYGYLLDHKDMGVTLFVTDTSELNYKFDDLSNLIIECNYQESILDQNYYEGKVQRFLYQRIKESHLSLEKLREFLLRTDLSKVRNIILCHLSDKNSDAKLFVEEMQKATGKLITIADKNIEVELSNF